MSSSAPTIAARARIGATGQRTRLAVLGPPAWLAICCPPPQTPAYRACGVAVSPGDDPELTLAAVNRFAPDVTVVLDPRCLSGDALRRLPGITLGILVASSVHAERHPAPELGDRLAALDRVASFRTALTGTEVAGRRIWRAIPPPIADMLYGEVRPLHRRPSVMTIGRSTTHRDDLLLPAKHHHDLLEIIHGVAGEELAALLGEYDAGVYVPREPGAGFGAQVGVHLAAGQLLFANSLGPRHGLEPGLDYLSFDSGGELVYMLDRLARFPEMYQRIRLRGRMKAEHYRASRTFQRIVHDLRLDVAAFEERRSGGSGG
ncbi:MAG TPA: hypothetical protein VMF14_12190 [Solirubrobacteraceae bacterium]|nr:hypothetical protein [Solirubrobacteraceae bacterium]